MNGITELAKLLKERENSDGYSPMFGTVMTQQEKYRIWELRQAGFGYKKIAKLLNLNEDTVKSYMRRTSKNEPPKLVCEECGKALIQKPRRFCSDRCRLQWRSKHPNSVNRSGFSFVCEYCGTELPNLSADCQCTACKRFADGKVSLPYKNFLGYKRGKDGKPQIIESEAKIVRKIYRLFPEGLTPTHINRRRDTDTRRKGYMAKFHGGKYSHQGKI